MCEEEHMNFTLPSDGMEEGQRIPGKEIYTISARGRGRMKVKGCASARQGTKTTVTSKLNPSESSAELNSNFLEDYFTAHSEKSVKTSNHTLSKLARPKMDVTKVKSALMTAPSFEAEKRTLFEEYRSLFDYWLFQLSNEFNILVYGVGSKRTLLEDFCKQILTNSCHFVINGFFPGLTIKQVLNQITSEVLGHSGTFKTDVEHAHYIKKALEAEADKSKTQAKKSCREIFFVIHNIDGLSLRGDNPQTCLSILAQSPCIYMLASIDHINTPLLWDQEKLSNFNWVWHDTTTYEPYVEESSYEDSLLVQQSGKLRLNSLIHVLQSLTSNARGIFMLVAKHQLDKKSGSDGAYLGMSYQNCYMKCREKFLVNSDLTLRTQLIEFLDHKLIKSRKGPDGAEYLIIPVDNGVLTQFMEHDHGDIEE